MYVSSLSLSIISPTLSSILSSLLSALLMTQAQEQNIPEFKLILVGDGGVGKTSEC
jgi:GTPase SAR1 family protein